MKSVLQLQLDNNYEILRVAYTKKKEASSSVHSFLVKPVVNIPLKEVPSQQVQQCANWDTAWFSHFE